jgi:hypothetical protein
MNQLAKIKIDVSYNNCYCGAENEVENIFV